MASNIVRAEYHPTEHELKAYHASKKTSSTRRHRTASEYGGTVTTTDDLSTIAGPNDVGSESPRISSLHPDFITGGFGGIDFSVPPLPGPAFDPHWLHGMDDFNLTTFEEPSQINMSEMDSNRTSLSLNNGLADNYLGNDGPGFGFAPIDGAHTSSQPDAELAWFFGQNQSGSGVQHIDGVDQLPHQSTNELMSAHVATPPEMLERRDSANPLLNSQLKCSYCDKRMARSCDLT